MRKVNCEACGASYELDPRRIPPNGMKMRCPACGASVQVGPEPGPLLSAGEPGADDLELDLPAPKRGPGLSPRLPAPPDTATRAGLAAHGDDLELSDLPALKPQPLPRMTPSGGDELPGLKPQPRARMSSSAADDFADLPAPKAAQQDPALKKTAPAVLRPVQSPGGTARPGGARPSDALDIDLPAPKAGPQTRTYGTPAKTPEPPREQRDAPAATPKKSFAKPGATASHEARDPSSAGTMPKDSLAIEPKPLFGSDVPVGMFGKLDDVAGTPGPAHHDLIDLPAPQDLPALKKRPIPMPDSIDLPAPQDLPAVKRPGTGPKATALGLGRGLPRDSLDLPGGFGAPPSTSSRKLPMPMEEPERSPRTAAPEPAPPDPLSELDLPAPRDLPAVKKRAPAATALGLGGGSLGQKPAPFDASVTTPSGPQKRSMPELSLDLPPLSGREPPRESPRGELELDDLGGPLGFESKGGGSFGAFDAELDLPPPRKREGSESLGDLEPIALPGGVSNQNAMPRSTMELAPDDLMLTGSDGGDRQQRATSARRSELGLELKGMLDLSSAPDVGASGPPRGLGGSASFGELDLGLGRESSVPLASPAHRASLPSGHERAPKIQDAELVEDAEADAIERRLAKRRARSGKSLPGWAIPLGLVLAVGATGTALGMFTQHGYFGVYLLEQLLPAAGDPARVREAVEHAERQARSDTYVDVRKALVTLSDARNEAGLNRGLLARSLLHEALYQLRFGEDGPSAQRSAAILARVIERGENAPGLALARAADAARRSDLAEAKRLLATAPSDDDAYRGLVAGEIALRDGQQDAAAQAFADAAEKGEVARGQWGAARALLAAGKLEPAEQAAQAALAASPRHSAAHTLLAERALARGEIERALTHVRAASGHTPIDGTPARPSRAERARAAALEGRIEEARDHPREAQAAYEVALAADPLAVDVLLGSGRMLMRLGRPQDALSRFDSALSAKPSETPGADGRIPARDAGIGAVQAMLALQRPQEALVRSTALIAQFPNDPETKLWHGHVLQALERWDDAEATFRETVEKAPKLFAGYVGLSQLLFKRGRPEEAARVLSRATGQVEDSAEVRRMLGHSELARNHLPEAVHQFEQALRMDPRDAGALFGLVVARRKAGAVDAADEALTRLEKLDPTFPGLSLERGQLLENRGEYAQAVSVYRRALEQRPNDSELKLRLGAALVTAGDVDEAEAVLGQVLKERPTSAEAEHYLGRVLFARKETAQAAQRFERAVNFDTLKADYHMYLAWALLEQGNYGGALQSIQRAIERDPTSGDARWLLGRIQLRTGAVRDALGSFQAALRLKPGRVEAMAGMGDAYDELRDLPQAVKSYQEALRRAPDNAEWWYRLGQLHLDRGSRDEARVTLAEAVLRGDRLRDRPGWLAEAHRAYADVLRESKRAAEASEHYKMFLELAPLGHPDRAEIEALVYQTQSRR